MPTTYRFINSICGEKTDRAKVRRDVRSYVARVSAAPLDPQQAKVRSGKRKKTVVVFDVELGNMAEDEGVKTKTTKPPPAKINAPAYHHPPRDPLTGIHLLQNIQSSGVYHLPYANLVLSNYFTAMAGTHPELDGPHVISQSRFVWMPKVLMHELLFTCVTLFACSFYAIFQRRDLYDNFYQPHIHKLRGLAIGALLAANRIGLATDELIGATAKMATWEAVYGTVDAYHIYMSAVVRMVQYRGGLHRLGMDGYLERMLLFIDNNSSYILQVPQILQTTMFPRRQPFAPNPDRFRVICGLAAHEPPGSAPIPPATLVDDAVLPPITVPTVLPPVPIPTVLPTTSTLSGLPTTLASTTTLPTIQPLSSNFLGNGPFSTDPPNVLSDLEMVPRRPSDTNSTVSGDSDATLVAVENLNKISTLGQAHTVEGPEAGMVVMAAVLSAASTDYGV